MSQRSGGEGTRTRAVRSDKKIHVNPGFDQETHRKLVKLATSCGMTKTEFSYYMQHFLLNNIDFVNEVQKIHNKEQQYWCYPLKDYDKPGEITY